MLCEECKQREATIHVTQIAGDIMAKHDYCEWCGQKYLSSGGINLAEFVENLEKLKERPRTLLPRDTGYSVAAFEFVQEAVGEALRSTGVRHVSAKELLKVLQALAVARFGKSAKSVLAGWGVHRTEDFGEIVFTLIDFGLLTKREEDRKDDFANGYDFDEVFVEN